MKMKTALGLVVVLMWISIAIPCTLAQITASDGDLRLIGASGNETSSSAGRLEIYLEGTWGTVCSDDFDFHDGDVACRQLGFLYADRVGTVGELGFSQGTGIVWLEGVSCLYSPSLSSLADDCGYLIPSSCSHSLDMALDCSSAANSMRLVSQTGRTANLSAGRLEILIGDQWGTVCSQSFDIGAAGVACRQLGYSEAVGYGRAGNIGYSSGSLTSPVWLTSLDCSNELAVAANASNLRLCNHIGTLQGHCDHHSDVILSCLADGNLRLVTFSFGDQTTLTSSGRLEIYLNNQWGTVCGNGFGSDGARVACQQLGYTGYDNYGNNVLGYPQVSSSSVPIWLDEVSFCSSSATTLLDCDRSPIGVHNCSHSEDVQLECSTQSDEFITQTPPTSAIQLRLASQTGRTSDLSAGRLEIFINDQWGTVCDDDFDIADADTACRQMGYSEAVGYGNAGDLGYPSVNQPIWLDDLACNVLSEDLLNCLLYEVHVGEHNCVHSEDVILSCRADGNLRLVFFAGQTTLTPYGRLEVYLNNQWGTVCDDGFDEERALVACQQLGYAGVREYGNDLGYPSAADSIPIWLDNVQDCDPDDTTLLSCYRTAEIGMSDCSHSQDVQLLCSSDTLPSSLSSAAGMSSYSTGIMMGILIPVGFLLWGGKGL